jgi:hypothetical protein
MIATSRWQLLGFNVSPATQSAPSESNEPEWVVTYFASTLFTPAGLDIDSRSKGGLSDEFIEGLIGDIGSVGEVGLLVKDEGMFRVNGGMFLNFGVQCHDRDAAFNGPSSRR